MVNLPAGGPVAMTPPEVSTTLDLQEARQEDPQEDRQQRGRVPVPRCEGSNPTLPRASCVIVGHLFNLPMPRFAPLRKGR